MHIGYCGMQCHGCDVYKATHMSEGEVRRQLQEAVAKDWTQKFGYDFQSANMICRGCQSDELCGYCSQCNIHACAREKGVQLCNSCTYYPCEKLIRFKQITTPSKETAFVF